MDHNYEFALRADYSEWAGDHLPAEAADIDVWEQEAHEFVAHGKGLIARFVARRAIAAQPTFIPLFVDALATRLAAILGAKLTRTRAVLDDEIPF